MTIHAMIDLETLDTRPSSTILTIGGVKFDPYTTDEPHSEFYFKVDIDEQDQLGRSCSDSTLEWWGKQSPEAQAEAFSPEDRVSVDTLVSALNKWVVGADVIWAHGYGFDMTIIEDLYRNTETPIPWNFWQIRDSRTLISLLPKDPRKDMQTSLHNALADSYFQAKSVQIAYQQLGIRR